MSARAGLTVTDVALDDGLESLLGVDADVYAVFWWRGLPLGARELTREQLASRTTVASLVAETIAPAVGARLFGGDFFRPNLPRAARPEGAPALEHLLELRRPLAALSPVRAGARWPAPADVSVVIATRRRPAELARALMSLEQLESAPREIVVVDNGPDDATRETVERHRGVVYVAEPRQGLSAARNAGVRAAEGSVLVFTDDDALVDPAWLDRLCAGFDKPDVMAVTGLVLPASLESRAELLFEQAFGGLGRGFQDRLFDRAFLAQTKRRGTPVWNLGAGVNLAVRREAFDRVGLFDERLGAGASGCSEDSELLYRLLAHGYECRYRADAVVRHHHRPDMPALARQMHDYARGHISALFVQFARHRHPGNLRRAFTTVPLYLLYRLVLGSDVGAGPPRETLRAEIRGYLSGLRLLPWAFRTPPRP